MSVESINALIGFPPLWDQEKSATLGRLLQREYSGFSDGFTGFLQPDQPRVILGDPPGWLDCTAASQVI